VVLTQPATRDAPVVLTQDILPSVGIGTDAPCILGLDILPFVGLFHRLSGTRPACTSGARSVEPGYFEGQSEDVRLR
jgi:hypothetical protein